MKFGYKLTLAFMSIILIALTITYFVYDFNEKQLEAQILEKLEVQSFHVMDKIDRLLYERFSDIKLLASDPVISSRNSTPRQIAKRLREFRNELKFYISLSFFDMNRIRIADTNNMFLGNQHVKVGYWHDVLSGKISAGSDIRLGEEINKPVIYFASPVHDREGKHFGVVVARMPITKVHNILKKTAGFQWKKQQLGIDLVGSKGLLLFSNYNRKGIFKDNLNADEGYQLSLTGKKSGNLISYNPYYKERSIYVFVHEQGYLDYGGIGWTLLLHVPVKIAFQPAIELRNEIITFITPIFILAFIVTGIFSRSISKPISKLIDATNEIGKGNLNIELTSTSKDELGDLTRTFDEMIKKRKRSEKELRESEEEYRFLADNQPALIWGTGPDGFSNYFNKTWLDFTGRTLDQEMGNGWTEGIHPDDLENCLNTCQKAIDVRELIEMEFRLRKADGTYRWLLDRANPHFGLDGNFLGYLGTCVDVTDRKIAEEKIYASEQLLRSVTDNFPSAIYLKDTQSRFIMINRYFEKLCNVTNAQAKGKTPLELFPPEVGRSHIENDQKVIESGYPLEFEEDAPSEGETRSYLSIKFPLRDHSGKIYAVGGISTDITERKKVEEKLHQSEEQIRLLTDNLPVNIAYMNNKQYYQFANKSYEKLWGLSKSEIIGKHAKDIIGNSNYQLTKNYIEKALSGETVEFETEFHDKQSNLKVFASQYIPRFGEGNKVEGFTVLAYEITDRKKSEDIIKKSLKEKEILLEELNHRTKNNMQIINSLLYLQALNIPDKNYAEMFKECSNRIKSMSLVHEKIFDTSDLSEIDFQDYIQTLAAELFSSYGVSQERVGLQVDAQKVSLGIDTGVYLGLIINELVSNALKHAFPDNKKGEIGITLQPVDGSKIELTITDDGVGFPKGADVESGSTLGLNLVKTLIEEQLNGSFKLNLNKKTQIKILFSEKSQN